jgi:acetyl-CoA C-acetyltransferase
MGNVHGNRGNIARVAALAAGCPIESAAYNLDRQCGSGAQAIACAAMSIMCGVNDIVIGCGVEHMTRSPHQVEKNPTAYDWAPPKYVVRVYAPLDKFEPIAMPQTADKLAKMKGVTRQDCDEFALKSHQRVAFAVKNGVFKEQIVPVEVKTRKSAVIVDTDECVRHEVSLEAMGKLPPLFPDGMTTAGNACPRSDGAGALVLMAEEVAKAKGIPPLAYFKTFASAGVDPTIMGYGPVPAITKLLQKTGLGVKDIGCVELNEAFAAQAVPCIRDLELDIERVNPNGGAIALGHPLGGTGAVLSTKLIYEMKAKGYQYGVVTMCIGGGQGLALLYERV